MYIYVCIYVDIVTGDPNVLAGYMNILNSSFLCI